MISTIYIEEEIANHFRTRDICRRFSKATKIQCVRYGEIFNRRAQNFRLQKRKPALILAKKYNHFVLPMPPHCSGIGGRRNFYFSHMLNCIYDCRYCFLAGMYQSAHYVVFVNYEDFQTAIDQKTREHQNDATHFFSGYDCDSLALDSMTKFTDSFLPFFEKRPNLFLELRTKSAQIHGLLQRRPIANCVVAFSFTPEEIAKVLEHKTPSVESRLNAMERLGKWGWKLGLHFDPLIYCKGYQAFYRRLFKRLFTRIDTTYIHSVNIGPMRFSNRVFKEISRLYPEEKLFAANLKEENGTVSYCQDAEEELLGFCTKELLRYIPKSVLFVHGNGT